MPCQANQDDNGTFDPGPERERIRPNSAYFGRIGYVLLQAILIR